MRYDDQHHAGGRPARSARPVASREGSPRASQARRPSARTARAAAPVARGGSARGPRSSRPAAAPRQGRIVALDGLRALAIAAVVVYHAHAAWLPGGFVGVSVFFVVSGFLITLSVTHEIDRTGTLRYPAFLWRRVRRLWPQMLATVGVVAVLTFLLAPNLLGKVKTDAIPAALFFENWFYIFRNVSYFAAAGQPSPLTHLWYLGVVMQFYVVWPLVLLLMDRLGLSRRSQAAVSCVLALASTVEMAVLYDPRGDTTRIYYGLDTRAAELLVGAACAFAYEGALSPAPRGGRRALRVGPGERPTLLSSLPVAPDVVAVAGLAVLAWFCVSMDGYTAFLYRGGFLLAALASGALVMAVAEPGCLVGAALSLPPLVWVGARSYPIYLWHYPLLILMNPATRTEPLPWWGWVLELAVVMAVSCLSHETFDGVLAAPAPAAPSRQVARDGRPVMRTAGGRPGGRGTAASAERARGAAPGHAQDAGRNGARGGGSRRRPAPWVVVDVACAVAVVAVSLAPIDLDAQTQGGGATAGYAEAGEDGAGVTTDTSDKPEQVARFSLDGTTFQGTPLGDAIQEVNTFGVRVDPETGATQANVLLIGDSVSGGGIIPGQDYFDQYFPNGRADYAVGRQLYVGPDIYAQYAADFDWGYVVWCLGNNGYATEDDVRKLVECVGDRPVYLVTVRESNGLTDHNNEVFRSVAAEYDNCQIIDWHAASEGHPEYFYDDGTHLRPAGGEAYMLLIRKAICGE